MFTKHNSQSFRSLLPGIVMRPLAFEEKTILCEFKLKAGHDLPAHDHPYEQTGYLLSGRLNFRIGENWFITTAGDSWCIPENIEHEVKVLEDANVLELFSPIRPDYLPDKKE
ncbi:cupin domain-containing protein [uncultured Draconibacterium sp.]|uniref:cupin domain-containing protein n=1 Tax=uncultured Draconibacterium sp. TaxID=1573823 RepID=UPI002AA6C3B7|nr:cupin domain-containing protein [uncultured Draconibacterium sp.]